MPGYNPVLHFLGTLVNTDHIRDFATCILTDLKALSEIFLLPQVSYQLLAKLPFGKHVQIGVNGFMTGLHILIVWIASLKLHADLNRRPTKLEFLYNKAMQFWVTAYPSAGIMTARKIISTRMS